MRVMTNILPLSAPSCGTVTVFCFSAIRLQPGQPAPNAPQRPGLPEHGQRTGSAQRSADSRASVCISYRWTEAGSPRQAGRSCGPDPALRRCCQTLRLRRCWPAG
ncbi:MAG: V-ski avian sarcoma viral oncogene-like protein [Caudoviricetes sp.]|nr:MAG: V-ski avian sarcoma viral oncogene-like protein [Caudoviricetes sp.]